jgi:hypothetical protein
MKSVVLWFLMALAAIPGAAESVRLSSDFFPLAVGNRWTYTFASENGKPTQVEMAISDHRIIGGRSYYVLTDYPFVADPNEKIRLIGYDRQEREFIRIVNEKEGPLFLADGASIDTLEVDASGLPQKVRVRLDTVVLTLQRGVGIIEARIDSPAGVRTATMSSVRVGEARASPGATSAAPTPAPNPNAPRGESLVSTVSQDNPRLRLETSPTPAGLKITFTVANTADRLLPFRFSSGQSFDLVIVNAAGNEVWRWARDQFFTSVVRSEALRPQSEWKYEAVWNHRDNAGNAVPPGEYRLKGVVAAQPPLESQYLTFTIAP